MDSFTESLATAGSRQSNLMTQLIAFAACFACPIPSSLAAQQPIKDPLLRWMNQIAQEQLTQRERVIAAIHTVADAERRKKYVRETLLEILGGLPDYNGPLNTRVTGRIEAESYVIEKVIFSTRLLCHCQSLPAESSGSLSHGAPSIGPYPGGETRTTATCREPGFEGLRVVGVRSGWAR